MKWAYGITTIPERRHNHLPQTIQSLWFGGFTEPRLFIDGCHHRLLEEYDENFHLPMTPRFPRIKTYKNWLMSLQELYFRDYTADRYAIFQDDIVMCKNTRQYLESSPYPSQGYLNLYTFPHNESRAPKDEWHNPKTGWYPSNQKGLGAVALVFSNEAVRILLNSRYMQDRVHLGDQGDVSVDGAVLLALMSVQWPEYVHYPSLTQHMGMVSSMPTPNHKASESFPGERHDALTFNNPGLHSMNIPNPSIQLK